MRAFEVSDLLSHMWGDAFMEMPQAEMFEIRQAWDRVRLAAKELREGGSGARFARLGRAALDSWRKVDCLWRCCP